MNPEVLIRRYKPDDLNVFLEMANKEGWDISHVDIRAGLEVDSNGFLVAENKEGGPVGFIGVFNMLPDMTYISDFIVRKDLRGKGIGKKLWSAMVNATQGNIIVLNGVSKMKTWYTQHGFFYEAYCMKFCKGTITSNEYVTDHCTYDITPLSEDVWPAFVTYDRQIFPYSREKPLRAWFWSRGTDIYSVVAMQNKSVVGYANFHWKSEKECNIRALCGDNKAVVDALLVKLLQNIPVGSVVSFYLLDDKPIHTCFKDFQCHGTSHKLYTKDTPGIQTDKIFINMSHMI